MRPSSPLSKNFYQSFSLLLCLRFYDEICVKTSKACCPSESQYGRNCDECPKGLNGEVCSGRGKCGGAGDREGEGGCKCDTGYKKDICDECDAERYFMETEPTEDQAPKCTRCHTGCKVNNHHHFR